MEKCLLMCVTDQCAESFRWVSTGDPRGVHSDLHHLLHVGRRRLTGIELPSWPPLWSAQRPTHIKLRAGLSPSQRRQQDEEEEERDVHGGPTVHQEVWVTLTTHVVVMDTELSWLRPSIQFSASLEDVQPANNNNSQQRFKDLPEFELSLRPRPSPTPGSHWAKFRSEKDVFSVRTL